MSGHLPPPKWMSRIKNPPPGELLQRGKLSMEVKTFYFLAVNMITVTGHGSPRGLVCFRSQLLVELQVLVLVFGLIYK